MLLVRAPYGQGKSHLGRLARELAAEHGLLTMHVELDGRGLSMRDGAGLVAGLALLHAAPQRSERRRGPPGAGIRNASPQGR